MLLAQMIDLARTMRLAQMTGHARMMLLVHMTGRVQTTGLQAPDLLMIDRVPMDQTEAQPGASAYNHKAAFVLRSRPVVQSGHDAKGIN